MCTGWSKVKSMDRSIDDVHNYESPMHEYLLGGALKDLCTFVKREHSCMDERYLVLNLRPAKSPALDWLLLGSLYGMGGPPRPPHSSLI